MAAAPENQSPCRRRRNRRWLRSGQLEARIGCRVDTNQTFLNLDDLHFRRQLWDLPLLDELQSACLGWTGAAVGLRAGHRRDAP